MPEKDWDRENVFIITVSLLLCMLLAAAVVLSGCTPKQDAVVVQAAATVDLACMDAVTGEAKAAQIDPKLLTDPDATKVAAAVNDACMLVGAIPTTPPAAK